VINPPGDGLDEHSLGWGVALQHLEEAVVHPGNFFILFPRSSVVVPLTISDEP
jgi:hypothetical protein